MQFHVTSTRWCVFHWIILYTLNSMLSSRVLFFFNLENVCTVGMSNDIETLLSVLVFDVFPNKLLPNRKWKVIKLHHSFIFYFFFA